MPDLAKPIEIFDLADGESVRIRIQKFERGEVDIQTRAAPAARKVDALRLWVPPGDKPLGAPYWDITSGTLIARLLPVLDNLVASQRYIKITKFGVAPIARHQVDFL